MRMRMHMHNVFLIDNGYEEAVYLEPGPPVFTLAAATLALCYGHSPY